MSIQVLFFGQITEITEIDNLEVEGIDTIHALRQYLFEKYPDLQDAKFVWALNEEIIQIMDNPILDRTIRHKVALLPPFAGG